MIKSLKNYFHHHLARPFYSLIRPLQPFFNLKKRTFFDKFKVKTKDGVEFWLYNNAFNLETKLFWSGFEKSDWEKKTREIWSELSKSLKVILDIGANTGIFSVLAKAYNSEVEVYAFEPQPNVFRVFQMNNEINGFDIQCHQLALSDESGQLPFYNTGYSTFEANNTTHGSLNKEWRTEHQHSIVVEVERLDCFLTKNQVGKVDLIKIDVETLEFEVLNGYGDLLWLHQPIIILEIQNEDIGSKLLSLFDGKEFEFFWINESKGLVPVDTLGTKTNQENLNYCLCPKNKMDRIRKWI
ncbi:FkbM family methyltransferase [Algoriphagus hitonicola]|uniref:Methyltransferase, FkbM family n=1 Tax=Algoriphagus hitonicola TaxID=435880 RepID=A0A1I2TNR8_9BACT|nr:FkbM family methyltransferase [Algoriphagus hitonicola]SFG63971.1 methyltransferase, FkbM family [Algoriphagus hitonicola]